MICPYCNKQAEWVENKEIYGRNYGESYMAYFCRLCNAYVGCHNNTRRPLGTMANSETREWRRRAHDVFDRIWKGRKKKFRDVTYKAISREFGFDVHIGNSDTDMCKKIISWSVRVKSWL